MSFAFLAVSAVIPSLFIMRYFHARDRYREPQRVLWTTFGLGVLSVFGVAAVFIYSPLVDGIKNPLLRGPIDAFASAAIPEELLKLLVLVGYCARHKEYDEPLDGLVYGATASLGFATLENVLYVLQNGLGLAVMRAFTAVPGHAFSGAILGWHVSQWKFHRKKYAIPFGYLVVVLLHGLYDAPLLTLKAMDESHYGEDHPARLYVGLAVVAISLPALLIEILWARRLLLRARLEQDGPNTRARNAWAAAREALNSNSLWDFVLLGVGGVLASLGGLLALGLGLSALLGAESDHKLLVGGLIMGVPPLFAGGLMFSRGLARRAARAQAEHAARWYRR
jgi:protease PrsW